MYWGTRALRGWVRICTSMSSLRLWNGTTIGKRPTNSGIIPNSIRSRASDWRVKASRSSLSATVFSLSLWFFMSDAVAARRPWLEDWAPKPKYWEGERQKNLVSIIKCFQKSKTKIQTFCIFVIDLEKQIEKTFEN